MRFDTQGAASYLVWRLQYAGTVDLVRDDGDIILVTLKSTGQRVQIHIIEREMTLADVQFHFSQNMRRGLHTLMIFWIDMLLPREGGTYLMDDWMEALVSVYEDKIYGFEVAGREAYFLPVHFEGEGRLRRIRYGKVVNYGHLCAGTILSQWHTLRGQWRVASFDPFQQPAPAQTSSKNHANAAKIGVLAGYFEVLGVSIATPLAGVRQAYYQLARLYHPDVNPHPEAQRRMSQINEAYQRILAYFESEGQT